MVYYIPKQKYDCGKGVVNATPSKESTSNCQTFYLFKTFRDPHHPPLNERDVQ